MALGKLTHTQTQWTKRTAKKCEAIDCSKRRSRPAAARRCRLDAWVRMTSRPSGADFRASLCALQSQPCGLYSRRLMRALVSVFFDRPICKKHERPASIGSRVAVLLHGGIFGKLHNAGTRSRERPGVAPRTGREHQATPAAPIQRAPFFQVNLRSRLCRRD